jgi:hypothetical protein
MKLLRTQGMVCAILFAVASFGAAQTWTPLAHQPTFLPDTAFLLTDGTVMTHQYLSRNWWRLTPDINGSYVNGTWSRPASLPAGYGPLYYASAVLADGKFIMEGGEYNLNQGPVETNLGAFYDPATNKWTKVNPPSGWTSIGDSPGAVLANGTFMMGWNSNTQTALFNETTLTWTATGSGKFDAYSEEGWVQLPDQTILTTDGVKAPHSEKYIPSTGKWVSAGSTKVRLEDPGSEEIGPMILLPNGTVFATGGNRSGAGHTSVYTPPANPLAQGKWTAGPDMPGLNDMADAPAALLTNGHVLCDMSPGIFGNPVSFYEYDGVKFVKVPSPANDGGTSYVGRMLVLPTGQILFTVSDGATKNMAIYNSTGGPNPAWAPTITQSPVTVTHGSKNNPIQGTQFNGLSNGSAYGDDAQMNTNYPLVRITNNATGHVFYAKTHNHSTMGVATGSTTVSTQFDVGAAVETGASTIVVVANGIASAPVNITVQ